MRRTLCRLATIAALLIPSAVVAQPRSAPTRVAARDVDVRDVVGWLWTDPVPSPTGPDADLSLARRSLGQLRERVRTLRARVIVTAFPRALEAQRRSLQRAAHELIPLMMQVAAARDFALTTEALVSVADAFGHVAEQTLRSVLLIRLTPAQARSIRAAEARAEAQRASSPPPTVNPLTVTFWCGPPDRESLAAWHDHLREELSRADREIAVGLYATAVAFAHAQGAMSPHVWHAIDRLQDDDDRPFVQEWMERRPSSVAIALRALFTPPTPGEALLETSLVGPPSLAR